MARPSLEEQGICEGLFVRSDKVGEVLESWIVVSRVVTCCESGEWVRTFMKYWPSSVSMAQ